MSVDIGLSCDHDGCAAKTAAVDCLEEWDVAYSDMADVPGDRPEKLSFAIETDWIELPDSWALLRPDGLGPREARCPDHVTDLVDELTRRRRSARSH